MPRVLTIGTFDPPHLGHAHLFNRCQDLAAGDDVAIGVNSDAFVASYKGRTPLYTEHERMALVGNFGVPLLNDGPGRDLVLGWQPDFLVVGSDWLNRFYLSQIQMRREELEDIGASLVYMPRTRGVSSTDLIARARA